MMTHRLPDPHARTRPSRSWPRREIDYKQKLAAIANGAVGDDFFFFSGEMVNYLLDRQGISESGFNQKLGFSRSYFSGNILTHGWNRGTAMLPEPFRKRMVELTRESLEAAGKDPEEFWRKRNFTLDDIAGITIDMTKDITATQVQYPKREPDAGVQAVLADIPRLAATLLIDPTSKQWRHNTFLHDAQGKFKPIDTMPSLRYIIDQYEPEEAIALLTTRGQDDRFYYDKGKFMKEVLKAAKDEHLINGSTTAIRYVPLRPDNHSPWSR